MPPVTIRVEVPESQQDNHLPDGVRRRLQALLDKQDSGAPLTTDEKSEAEGLVDLADWLTLLKLGAERIRGSGDEDA
jgi:hypothetical protein